MHPSCVEWNSIGEVLGPHIRHLSLDPHYEHRMNEYDLKQFIQHFHIIEEFRVGPHFDREVVGKFVNYLSKTCKLFYSNGIYKVWNLIDLTKKNFFEVMVNI